MAWDSSGRYYYRSRWVSGRPVREYVGTGLLARLQADLDEAERQQQAERRAQEQVVPDLHPRPRPPQLAQRG